MKYVLIIIYLTGYGPRAEIKFQEFNSLEACHDAENIIFDNNKWYDKPSLYCVVK